MMTHPAPRPLADIPHALVHFPALLRALAGRRPAVFLDYDGTLTPIVARPELAVLAPEARAVVERVAARFPTAVISGRDREDVTARVGVADLVYAGSHGFDIHVPGRGEVLMAGNAAFPPLLAAFADRLEADAGALPGVLVERKRFSVAVHYRQAAEGDLPFLRRSVERALAAVPGLRMKPGKKIFEIQPAVPWDKGQCVLGLLEMQHLEDSGHMALFIGDDVTDEDAFAALAGRGLGVVVAHAEESRSSAAAFRVDDVTQALGLLSRLVATAED